VNSAILFRESRIYREIDIETNANKSGENQDTDTQSQGKYRPASTGQIEKGLEADGGRRVEL
jgi:hypothetical protein